MSKTKIEALIHDVNSTCGKVRSAAALLRTCKPENAGALLTILSAESDNLRRVVADFQERKVGDVQNP